MGLFKKKTTPVEGGHAKVLNKEKLNANPNVDKGAIDDIVKTTDSMKVIARSYNSEAENMEETARAIKSTYSIATKKIIATYEEIVETKKIIDNEFLTVQLLIGQYERNSDIESINKIINYFTEEVEAQIAHGRSVKITDSILLEPNDYAGKAIPVARIVDAKHVGINITTWENISEVLKTGNLINASEQESLRYLVEAIETNIFNGYFLKLGNLVIAKIDVKKSDLMVLFSKETIAKLNSTYSHDRLDKRKQKVEKTNYIESYKDSVNSHDAEEQALKERLAQIEAEGETSKQEKTAEILEKEQQFADGMKKVEEIQKQIDKRKAEEELLKQAETRDIEDIVLNEVIPSKQVVTTEVVTEVVEVVETTSKPAKEAKAPAAKAKKEAPAKKATAKKPATKPAAKKEAPSKKPAAKAKK